MAAIQAITVGQIQTAKARRAEIIASQPAFGSPNSHHARKVARRAAKRIEKQIYRARKATTITATWQHDCS